MCPFFCPATIITILSPAIPHSLNLPKWSTPWGKSSLENARIRITPLQYDDLGSRLVVARNQGLVKFRAAAGEKISERVALDVIQFVSLEDGYHHPFLFLCPLCHYMP